MRSLCWSLVLFHVSAIVLAEPTSLRCARENLSQCTKHLTILTDNKDLGFASSRTELLTLCPSLLEGIDCFNRFIAACLSKQHQNYFESLYRGTQEIINELCLEGAAQREYLSHAPCMRSVQHGYEVCADLYHNQAEDMAGQTVVVDTSYVIKALCCSFQNFLMCTENAVNNTCGHATAQFSRDFLQRLSGPLVHTHCETYSEMDDQCLNGQSDISLKITLLILPLVMLAHNWHGT